MVIPLPHWGRGQGEGGAWSRSIRVDVRHLEGAALLEPDDVEVEDGLALVVEADLPEPVVSHGHERLLDRGGVVDGASLLHRLDQHVDVVIARGREGGSLI